MKNGVYDNSIGYRKLIISVADTTKSFARGIKAAKEDPSIILEKIADYAKKTFNDWFYFHEVLGQNRETIYALKIKTMTDGANKGLADRIKEEGLDVKLGKPNNGKYIIKGRGWLRTVFIDELPQLIYNVIIKKNMRIVGERPRPLILWLKDIEDGLITKEEMDRALKLKPGLWGVQYRYPKIPAADARKKYRAEKKARPYSVDLGYFLGTNWNILTFQARSR